MWHHLIRKTTRAKQWDSLLINWKRKFSLSMKVNVGENINLHVESLGRSEDKVLLCLPGALGTAQTDFGPQLKALSKYYRVIAFDPRGYGQSRPPQRQFSQNFLEQDAEDAATLMNNMGIDKYAVVGWSDGANAAVILAANYPQNVNRLILMGGNAYLTEEDLERYEKTRNIENWSERMRESFLAIYGNTLQSLWTEWNQYMIDTYKTGGDLCTSYLPLVQCKTLVLHGKKDVLVPEFHSEYLNERILHSKLLVLEDAKHNLHLQYPEKVNSILHSFLEEANDQLTHSREFVAMAPKNS